MNKTENILIRCDSGLKKRLKNLAKEKGSTMSEIINGCIREELRPSKVQNMKKEKQDMRNQISKQGAQLVAGCIYHTQNILNKLEQEQIESDFIRKEMDALWDMLN